MISDKINILHMLYYEKKLLHCWLGPKRILLNKKDAFTLQRDAHDGTHMASDWYPWANMMTSSNGKIFRTTGSLCGEFTGHW